jgi:hypothetical protein
VTSKIFESIAKLKNLMTLETDSNNIQSKALMHIYDMENITTLVIGNTELTEDDIRVFLIKTKARIKKLSLKRENYDFEQQQNSIDEENDSKLKNSNLRK